MSRGPSPDVLVTAVDAVLFRCPARGVFLLFAFLNADMAGISAGKRIIFPDQPRGRCHIIVISRNLARIETEVPKKGGERRLSGYFPM
jgi:hypothetical protein